MRQRHKIVTIAAELAYLPATRAVAQSIDGCAHVLHKPLLYLVGGDPLRRRFHDHCFRRHLTPSVRLSIYEARNVQDSGTYFFKKNVARHVENSFCTPTTL